MFLFALALAQAAPFDTKADYVELARTHCASEWPDNFEMQGYCMKQQATGCWQFKEAATAIGKPHRESPGALHRRVDERPPAELGDDRILRH
jgi:hypothetical protein